MPCILCVAISDFFYAYKKKQRAKVEPFPTIYWLASTELKARVSTLEDQQFVLTLRLDCEVSILRWSNVVCVLRSNIRAPIAQW